MPKKIIRKIKYEKILNFYNDSFTLSDLPEDILPTDEIVFTACNGVHTDNEEYDDYSVLSIYEKVLETDEEYEKRINQLNKDRETLKNMRYASYLKLKNEFENDGVIPDEIKSNITGIAGVLDVNAVNIYQDQNELDMLLSCQSHTGKVNYRIHNNVLYINLNTDVLKT